MVVGVAVLELHVPESRSLKDKRRIVRSLSDRVHERLRMSVAETGFHDLHQRCEIGIAAVGTDEAQLGRLFETVRSLAEGFPEAMVCRFDVQFLECES
jgi:uncharacterized protein YlxP (DUF503 family)